MGDVGPNASCLFSTQGRASHQTNLGLDTHPPLLRHDSFAGVDDDDGEIMSPHISANNTVAFEPWVNQVCARILYIMFDSD